MKPDQLTAWRKAGNMSRERAAKLLGCSAMSVRRYETGQSPIPAKIAAATLAMGKTPDAGIELVPPYDPANQDWDNPWSSPRLYQRMPGKKIRWERIEAGKPMRPPGATYDSAPPADYKPEGDPKDYGYDA